MSDLLRLVADGHLIENDTVGPHVHSWRDPGLVGHFGRLVVLSAHTEAHVGHLLALID